MLLGLPELSSFIVAQKLQVKEKSISLKVVHFVFLVVVVVGGFFDVFLASNKFLHYMCVSPSPFLLYLNSVSL